MSASVKNWSLGNIGPLPTVSTYGLGHVVEALGS